MAMLIEKNAKRAKHFRSAAPQGLLLCMFQSVFVVDIVSVDIDVAGQEYS